MTIKPSDLQEIWETLNGILYDLEEGIGPDVSNIEDCIDQLEKLGVGE